MLTPPERTSPSSPTISTIYGNGYIGIRWFSWNLRLMKLLVAPKSIRVYAFPIDKVIDNLIYNPDDVATRYITSRFLESYT